MRRLYLFGILVFISAKTFSQQAQATCAQTLRLARATYEQGRLHEIEGQLKSCLESGFTKEEKQLKVEGYKILCLSYIYLEEPEKADEAMLNLKKADPYFRPNPQVDPAEFVALFNTFRIDPIYRIGAKLGGNFSRPNVQESVSAVELGDGSEFKPSFGLQFGAAADFPMFKRITFHTELLYQQHRYEINETVDRVDPGTGEQLTNEFNGIESQTWLSLPITVEYAYLNQKSKLHEKLRPYLALGLSVSYLLNAKITAERQREGESSIPESGIDVDREKINIGVVASTGIKYKIASGLFVADVRYIYGITNVSSSATAFNNQRLLWEYGYADPVFKMGSIAFTLSYVQDIFKPKKLNKKK
ncbi:MAG TPA: porin family protein [Cyclobacteriaceae bacterium]|nr:porin family protein [Cyclobacteriaceae bacterium]